MSNLRRQALVAELIRQMQEAGSWCGRTHIQKTLYVFQTLFHPEEELTVPFILYKHGPYSFELDRDLAEMEFYGGIEREDLSPFGASYHAGPGTETLRQRFGAGVEALTPQLQFAASRVSTSNVRELEALATALYVATQLKERTRFPTPQDQLARVRELKPHLGELEVERAQTRLQELEAEARALTLGG